MILLDDTPLFTNLSHNSIKNSIEKRWYGRKKKNFYFELKKKCFFFQFDDVIYEGKFGTPKGFSDLTDLR